MPPVPSYPGGGRKWQTCHTRFALTCSLCNKQPPPIIIIEVTGEKAVKTTVEGLGCPRYGFPSTPLGDEPLFYPNQVSRIASSAQSGRNHSIAIGVSATRVCMRGCLTVAVESDWARRNATATPRGLKLAPTLRPRRSGLPFCPSSFQCFSFELCWKKSLASAFFFG
jgi:hypothetical protein